MRKAVDDTHWEEIVRTILERLGAQAFAELIDYVLDQADHADQLMEMDEPPPPIQARAGSPP